MKARIGMVNFINTAPLYVTWQKRAHRDNWHVTEAPPTTLNRMLFADELDLGFVSSHEYAAHPQLYCVLDGLSISSTGTVGSVFLFSKVAPANLSGKLIHLSTQSQTSVALVKILLEEFVQVSPCYSTTEGEGGADASAVLAIGDEALRLKQQGGYSFSIDLGEMWQQHTGLPFVFAVWAVRRDFFTLNRQCVDEIHQELLACVDQGKKDLRAICAQVAPRIPMDVSACYDYLCCIEYDLGPQKRKALELFFEFLIKRGEAPQEALPVKICG